MDLSYNLKTKREENNFSQEDVAKVLNISRQSISKWENGNCYPDLDNLIKLSDLYKISLDELIKGDKSFQEKIIIKESGEKMYRWPWWIIFPIMGMLYGLISMILDHS
nr:helix-turn-helix transcriptional regulator [Priestia megaterium]MDH3188979.1 helix-turn-helix transcriptional regulator [Priestia megaterium]MDH3188991.1 helix-turn-helix transcriptional regulator [Priestia megaterium]